MYNEFKAFYGALKDEKDYDALRRYFNKTFPMFNKLILCEGWDNIVTEGPSIITANQTGTGRDIIGLLREYDRQLHFVAGKYLFNKEASIKKAKEQLGPRKYHLLEKMIENGAALVSERMTSFEMIPVDLDYSGSNERRVAAQREAMNTVKDYLRKDKAVVLFQLRKNYMGHSAEKQFKEKSLHHNSLYKFSNTVSKIALELHDENITVPITPVAFYGSRWWNPFAKTIMRIGKPVYPSIFADSKHKVHELTDFLEMEMAEMLIRAGIPKNKDK